MSELIIFTDGSCLNNGKKYATAGYGIHYNDNSIKDISRPYTHQPITNNTSELYAIYKSIKNLEKKEIIDNYESIILYTDSQYSMNSLTVWIKNWIKNNWIGSDGKAVKNRELIEKVHKKINKYNIKLLYSRAHTGNSDFISLGNAKADTLAKAGLNKNTKK